MDKTVFLNQWFSFDLQYYFISSNTNNVLHSSVIVKITACKLAFCKSTSHIPANIPHPTPQTRHISYLISPTSHIPNITHFQHPTSQTFHILNIPHPISQTPHILNTPHPQHPTSRNISKYVLRLSMQVFLVP